jgi:hypothetical protein
VSTLWFEVLVAALTGSAGKSLNPKVIVEKAKEIADEAERLLVQKESK